MGEQVDTSGGYKHVLMFGLSEGVGEGVLGGEQVHGVGGQISSRVKREYKKMREGVKNHELMARGSEGVGEGVLGGEYVHEGE